MNRTIKRYPTMDGFFGMEDTIQRVVSYFQHAAQGLEERKQVLYLLGPVGGGKSSLAERLKLLMESQPIYVLQGRRRDQPDLRIAPWPVRSRSHGRGWRANTASKAPPDGLVLALGDETARQVRRQYFRSSPSSSCIPPSCARSASPRPSRATRTTRTFPPWSARSTSASWSISASTTRTPTAIPAGSTAPPRACWSLSKCSRRRSRCCIRC